MDKKKIFKIVLIRHGESLGNLENRFTGWLDVDLTKNGFLESYKAGIKLKNLKYDFDLCYTSKLKRAIKTSWSILDAMNLNHIKIIKSVDLNERNYGGISGMNKLESVIKYGKFKVNNWLNKYKFKPPVPVSFDKKLKILKKKYKNKKIPLNESLEDLSKRILNFWEKIIKNKIKKKKILIVAHSNILKILTNHINKEKSNNIVKNSKPIIYEFNEKLEKLKNYLI
ncbi:phosphoglyceromutase [Candidatus Nasuia deltocephalinicola]|uniref:2,3-bisphosphoglycerate-dependent phosphoglycerate mutase n=1 Tax=Candidatus Nasuia deltocephalincola TaxID=1160784 RepID=A0A975A344_9PROT|nr:phosphoglyceromutase [Candidatus Nasuia deltocephalinicola]